MTSDVAGRRLHNQYVTGAGRRRAADVVTWLGAVQAQEYPFARWGLALRMHAGATDAAVERAFNEGEILRTHVMRPTWHFVARADIRWMLELTAPHVHRAIRYYERHLELDAKTLARAARVIEHALSEHRYLTRAELGHTLGRAGLAMKGQRLAHTVMHAELEGIVCSGPRRQNQFTYALLAERAPAAVRLTGDEALGELTRRFFRSHGPATVRDFVWWSGLTTACAKRGLDINRARREDVGGLAYWTIGGRPRTAASSPAVHLLPVYDEYLVAYRDREAVPHAPSIVVSRARGPVRFLHALVVRGQVAGTWRTRKNGAANVVEVCPLRPLARVERRGVADAVERYGRFLGSPVSLSVV